MVPRPQTRTRSPVTLRVPGSERSIDALTLANRRNKRAHITPDLHVFAQNKKPPSGGFLFLYRRKLFRGKTFYASFPDTKFVAVTAMFFFRSRELPSVEEFGFACVSAVDHRYSHYTGIMATYLLLSTGRKRSSAGRAPD